MTVDPAAAASDAASPVETSATRDFRQGVIAALLLAVGYTLFCVQWSLSRGRLSQDPTYDDSMYLFEAGRRLAVLYERGFVAYLANLYRDAPHAPFTDFGAELSFGIFGLHDWVPYVFVNGPTIAVLLLAIAYFMRSVRLRARIAMMAFALTIPFVVVGVHEFRPDFPGALFTALGISLVIEAALHHTGPAREKQFLAGGFFFGLALVTKAVFFVHTLTMEAGSILGACALTWWAARATDTRQETLRRSVRIAAVVAIPSLIIWAPYILVNFRETFGYFYDFALGKNSHVSEIKGGLAASAYFYTFGYAGMYMLGRIFFVGLALYVFSLVCVVWSRNWKELIFQGFLLGCACVSLGSIILNQRENHYFGVPADTLLLFMLVRAVTVAWTVLCGTRQRAAWGLTAMVVLCVVNLSLLNPVVLWPYSTPQWNYVVSRDHSINERLLDDIWREFGARAAVPADPPITFVTRGGTVTAPTFRWLALKAGRRLDFTDVWVDNDVELFRAGIQAATFVVAPEDNATGVYNQNAAYNLRFEVEHMLAATPGLRLLRRYPSSPGGPAFRLFVNDDKLVERYGGFGTFEALEGFLPWEGPYPEVSQGKVRWGVGPKTRFSFQADAPGNAMLHFSVRADAPVRGTLQLRGVTVLKLDAPHLPDFQKFTVPVTLQPGENEFVLTYESEIYKAPDGYQRALLFRQLDLTAPNASQP